MKIAYFDCFSGASGDMILGALLDAGLELELLRQELSKLPLSHFEVRQKKVRKNSLGGTQAEVIIEHHHHHHHRHLCDIKEIIEGSSLPDDVKQKSLKIFHRLAEAEARVHRTTVEQIHFHEVGAMDSIIDVVGSVVGLAGLGVERIYCSPLHVGSGTVQCAHGILPVPAPATAELIKGVPFYSRGVEGELLTPTGAAILTTLAVDFGPLPNMSFERIGYGAGTADLATPNLLRVFIGEGQDELKGYQKENVAVLETNIYDPSPQMYDHLLGNLLNSGALEVFLTQVQMNNNRPGALLTVICQPTQVERCSHFLLRETTNTGLRWRIDNRLKARAEIKEFNTPYGSVHCRVAEVEEGVPTISPEYEDLKRIALEQSIPLEEVMERVRAALPR
jgi:pyridinium-3,5-bisthiocarboxylic acid mononucleotide nickel chelatase